MAGSKDKNRSAFQSFMSKKGLKAHPWAKKAGVRSSTLYNYIAGTSDSLSSDTLQKLAKAAGVTVDEILGGRESGPRDVDELILLGMTVGIFGRLYAMDKSTSVKRPVGLAHGVRALAARIDGDGLHPIPPGWLVFYEEEARPASSLLGKLAVVTVVGGQVLIREIRRGVTPGLFTLAAWNASPIEDAQVLEARLVLTISQG